MLYLLEFNILTIVLEYILINLLLRGISLKRGSPGIEDSWPFTAILTFS